MTHLTILSGKDIESVHHATLRVLDEIGVVLSEPEAREILRGAGARVRGERILFPPDLVESTLAKCPSQVAIHGRNGHKLVLGDGDLHWHNTGGSADVYEPHTGDRRAATVQDVRDATRLLDALDGVSNVTPFFTPQDVPGPVMSLSMYRHALPYTTKPLQGPGIQTAAEVRYAVQMASVIGTPEEVLSLSVSSISPLFFPDALTKAIIEVARSNVVFAPLPCPTAGATAPLSLAGALAQQSAEVLTSIIIAQVVQPGLPVIYCGRLSVMDPRTGVSVWGGVELGLISAATVQIGHYYNLPVNVYGFCTNSNVLDFQSGYERALNAAIPALAGADELSGIGEMAAGVHGSYAQMVADNEIVAGVRRLRSGFTVDDDSLAFNLIAQVMNGSHNYLDQPHTVRYLRAGEVLHPKLADRRSWDEWSHSNQQLMTDRAQAESERILATHEVPPLSEEQERHLDEVMKEAASELVVT